MDEIGYIEQKKNTHLYFMLGANKYAVNTSCVLEIMKLPLLDYPQKLPNNIVGLLKYNNFVINIVDIRFYLNTEVPKYTANNDLLIVKTDETIYGIITDKILGIVPFESSNIDAIPFADSKTIIDSLYKQDSDTVFIINIYAIEKILKGSVPVADVDIPSLFPKDAASISIMQKRTQEIADKSSFSLVAGDLYAKRKLISFNLNNDRYCISSEMLKEVVKDTYITKVPGTPDFIAGIMNLRGDYITVLDLKKFLNLDTQIPDNKKDNPPVIIASLNDNELALKTDKINELFEIQEDKIISFDNGYYQAEFINNGVPYTILNIEKIFADKRIVVTDM